MTVEPAPASPDEPYPGAALLGAAAATFFFPVISLIAALLLLSAEKRPSRRASLRAWAWGSVAWIALQGLVLVFIFGAFASGGSGGGGPAVPVP